MSPKKLVRRGFTLEAVLDMIWLTLLNPLLTVPIYLIVWIFQGSIPAITGSTSLLLVASIMFRANDALNDQICNNWVSDTYNWSNETVLITGGSNGIGAAIVQNLAKRNIKTIILDIQKPSYPLISAAYFYKCDLSSTKELAAVAAAIQDDHGDPTVLINNAGIWNRACLLQTSNEETSRLFAINTLAQYQLLKAFLPSIVRRNHGIVVTVSSVAGFGGSTPGMVDYAASKAAAVALHEGLSAELVLRYGSPAVRTVLVVPNVVQTPMAEDLVYENAAIPILEPRVVAERALEQILRGRSGVVIVPRSVGFVLAMRAWPTWMQRALLLHPAIAEATTVAEKKKLSESASKGE